MRLSRNDWIVFAWAWLAGMSCLGVGLLITPRILPPESGWVNPGSGPALLLVAASILFVVALDPLTHARGNRLLWAAGILTAVFGYAGTLQTLDEENPLLQAVMLVATFYVAWIGGVAVLAFRLFRRVFGNP